ncbi:LamG-like jellyroll fold domain-containing protein [Actinocorallia sp. A-T 12471]|uniref:LamG-like jellyroll fold domain-containing protein n=1 Tax=Actinocorallia sp. A-T 12471 TaxID=3089813 RepID=UPI0029CF7777|nr:LamG-like jellyroll fold domain-containing protein [Actinocorallia sp. A-T 12471]MDX6740735.1 LamG-like jellyroll fold domain-containing protein [Actinocorallia sp. A-T 12471]
MISLSLSQVFLGLVVLVSAVWAGAAIGRRLSGRRRREVGRFGRRSRVRLAVTAAAALIATITADSALAVGGLVQTPALTLPDYGTVKGLVTGEPKPDWGKLPRQDGGSAKDSPTLVDTEETRDKRKGNGHKPKPGKGELPEYEPLKPKHAEGPSAKGTVGFVERTSKRIPAKSTATSTFYENADGTTTRIMSQTPVNYRDENGVWKEIDTTLTRSGGRLSETANDISTDFAGSAADPRLVSMTVGGHEISYGLEGAAAVQPTVSGSAATYPDALSNTDVELEATPTGVKETLILKSADAPTEWVFPLDTGGLTPVLDEVGGILFQDPRGKVVTRAPPPFAEDAKFDPASGLPASTKDVRYRLEDREGAKVLVMTLNPEWLAAPERVFPVKVDPTYTMYSTTTYVMTNANGDHSMERLIAVGSWDNGPHTARSYLKFPDQGIDGSGVTVTAAKLQVFNVWASTCAAMQFDMFEGLEPWNSWDAKMQSYATSPGYTQWLGFASKTLTTACTNTSFDPTIGEWIDVPVAAAHVPIIDGWAKGTRPNYGLVLSSPVNDNAHWKQFASSNNWSTPPKFVVTYTGKIPPRVRNQAPAEGTVFDTLTPTLSATGEVDPSVATTRIRFSVYDDANTLVADSGNVTATDSAASWTVPANKLTWGKSYYWTAQTYDGTSYSPDPDWYTFSVQVPQPLILSSLSENDERGFDPGNGNYTTSAVDADVEVTGPDLAVNRDYNSRDPRITGAFGAAWSSVFDAEVAEQYTTSGAVKSVNVTYPDGAVTGFGKNGDGSFSPPSGLYVSFRSVTGGYTLTDKNGTIYTFTQSLGGGRYGISSIADASGRALNFTWTSGRITKATSAISGRSLTLTWATPSGAQKPHVTTVTTDPATPGNPATVQTWTYTYTGDRLTQVCSSGCTAYGYTSGSNYHSQVLDRDADSYWPLAETSGTVAKSANLENQGSDSATYANVTLGVPGPLAGGSATAASFNGTNSLVQLPRTYKVGTKRPQAISLWFKGTTPNGVLFSYSNENPRYQATAPSDYTPALYVDSAGKLNGSLFTNQPASQYTPITSPNAVTDGNWHNVVLTGDGGTQWLYLDGVLLGSKTGLHEVPGQWNNIVGAGYLGYKWPNQPNYSATVKTGYANFYNGQISNVAYFDKTLTQGDVGHLLNVAKTPNAFLTSTTRPSGKAFAAIAYDGVTGTVTQVTDENGGVWKIAAPTAQGSSAVFRGAVLGAAPATYFRLADAPGSAAAADELNAGTGTYANVTLGAAGPFADSSAASFNGTSSYLQLPTNNQVTSGPGTVEMWFKMPAGNTAGGVLFAQQDHTLVGATGADWGYVPVLYVGVDGKLRGKFWDVNGSGGGLVSTAKVNDGAWHHVMLSATANSQTLFLDGAPQGSPTTGALQPSSTNFVYVGAGMAGGSWPSHPTNTLGYFPGSIAHVAFYRSSLTGQDAEARMVAARGANGLAPMKSVVVTDPGNKTLRYDYDLANGGRLLAITDPLGKKTSFGYDTGGFLHTVTDANGNIDVTGHDVRGNIVSRTSCQNQAANQCSTEYFSYWPDATTKQLTPDPRNDLLLTERDGRSTGPTDDRFLTVHAYDTVGNETEIVTAPVPGFPAGRFTKVSYTNGTTIAAADGGFAPPSLPYRTVSPGGATTNTTYYKNGDIAKIVDAAGQETRFTYDGLGRKKTVTVVSDANPAGLTTTLTYDAIGNVTEQLSPPATNRVTGAVHTPKTVTTYDADSNVLTQTISDLTGGDAPRITSQTYNAFGQLATSTDARGKTTTFAYDAYGNRIRETDETGQITEFGYDPNGRLTTTTLKNYVGDPNDPLPATNLVVEARAYDPAGRLATVTDALGYQIRHTYTDNDLTTKVTRVDQNGQNPYVEEETAYDAAGNEISKTTNNGATTETATIDSAGRVVATALDPSGVNRRTTVSYTADDEIATLTETDNGGWPITTSFTYDPLGRMKSKAVSGDDPGHPLGWWRLNQTSGTTVHDATGDGFTAAAGPGVSWADNAAVFNGAAGAQIATNGPVVDTSQNFTISAWVKPATLATTQTVVSQDGNRMSGFFLKYESQNGKWVFMRVDQDSDSPTAWPAVNGTTPPQVGTWAHLTATFNAADGTMALYVNGQPQGTATNATPFNAAGPLVIGRAKYAGAAVDWANGSIANVQAYNRVLTPTDITKLYTNGRNGGTTASYTKATTRWALDQRGLATSITDPNGHVTDYVYDENGRPTQVTLPTVNVETGGGTPIAVRPVSLTGYDTFGDTTEVQDFNGNVTVTAYDAEGQRTKVTQPSYTAPGAGSPTVSEQSWTYDDAGQVAAETDGLGKTTTYTYDQLGNVAKIEDAKGGLTKTAYNANGQAVKTVTPGGAQRLATYDHLGRPLTETVLDRYPSPTTSTTTYSYTASATNPGGAFLASETSAGGVTTTFGYNKVGEQTRITDAGGASTTTVYDQRGRPSRVNLHDGTSVRTNYDLLDNPTTIRTFAADGTTVLRTVAHAYDAAGQLISITDARGHTTTFTRDALGQVTAQTEPVDATSGITTSFGYDANGNRTRFTDGRNNPWIYTYNSWNKTQTEVQPAAGAHTSTAARTTTVTYDANGNTIKTVAPDGATVNNAYDDLGRLTGQTGSGADAGTATRTFTFDADSRLTKAETSAVGVAIPATSQTFSYNDRGLPLTAAGSAGSSGFAYNADGRLTSRVDAAGTTSYTYDAAGRLATLNDPATSKQLTYGYNTMSELTSVTYGAGGNVRTFGYDNLHRLTSDTLKSSGGSTIASVTYGYDANDNETSKTTTGITGAGTNTYTYDRSDRLTSWNNGSVTTLYEYDASGNRTRVGAKTFTYDARNQLTSDGTNTYIYTARGTLAVETRPGGAVTYTSDAYGQQITQATVAGGTQTYRNDALGRNVSSSGDGGSRTFTYTGLDNALASDGSSTYTRTPNDTLLGIGTPNGSGGSTGTGVFAFLDVHFDVIANFTGTGGLSGSTTFDPLGNVVATTSMAGNLGFQSGWTDAATGKVDMWSRWYTPATGQFQNRDTISLDPVGDSIANNGFAYVDQNPLTDIDPTGHCGLFSKLCGFTNAIKNTVSNIKTSLKPVSTFVSNTYKATAKKAKEAAKATKRAFQATVAKVKDVKKQAVKKVKNYYTQKKKQVRDTTRRIKEGYANTKKNIRKKLEKKLPKRVIKSLTTSFKIVEDSVKGTFKMATDPLVSTFKCAGGNWKSCGNLVKTITNPMGDPLENAKGFVDTVSDVVGDCKKGDYDSCITKALTYTAISLFTRKLPLPKGAKSPGAPKPKPSKPAASAPAPGPKPQNQPKNSDTDGVACPIPAENSFVPGTLVLMADGSTKPIEKIKIGEKVLAGDVSSGKNAPRTVVATIEGSGEKNLTTLTIDTDGPAGSDTATLTATDNHPFWVPTLTAWTDAEDLNPGQWLQLSNGTRAQITAVTHQTRPTKVHNLTITTTHTYYVLAGQTPVLVHNCGGSGDPTARGGVYTLRDADDNVVRTGRTNDLARREREHGRADETADFRFQVEYRTNAYREQRGLEQIIWMLNGRPTLPGVRRTSPVRVRNRNYNNYMDAAGQFFARWFPN